LMTSKDKIVKTEFDFGYAKWKEVPEVAKLALENQKGDVLDVGCSTCQLASFMRENGWKGKYFGIDLLKHEGHDYPKEIDLVIGDAVTMPFPEVDTVVMYDILEHVDDPAALLSKALKAARSNVLIKVPLRNEEMWNLGVVEPHQKDRTHKHAGFSREEVRKLVELSGGSVAKSRDLDRIDATTTVKLWRSRFAMKLHYLLAKMFSSREFHATLWCEVVRASR